MGLYSNYSNTYEEMEMMYPAEDLIRIFKGSYPALNLPSEEYGNSSILDVGCGDGRHLVFFSNDAEFETYGMEPTKEICEIAESNVADAGADVSVHPGTNRDIPFDDDQFDYLVAWNSCYYMGEEHDFDFDKHVREYQRVLKSGGKLILSIPKHTSFIYEECDEIKEGYIAVKDDPFGDRDGTILRRFEDDTNIKNSFSPQFGDFSVSSIHDDFFGYNYHWWLLVAEEQGK